MREKDITFFCSPIGLGHATRDYAILQGMSERYKENSLKFFSGSSAVRFFESLQCKVQDIYNPPPFTVKDGTLHQPLRWLWSYYKYYKRCRDTASKVIRAEKPKIVVSDEDFASLAEAQDKKIPNVLITDILETNFTKGPGRIIERKMNSKMKEIMKKCDTVILPEEGKDQENIIRVGPIVRRTPHTRDELRNKFSFNNKTVLISVGGTDAGMFLIKKSLEAVQKLAHSSEVEVILVSGPVIGMDFAKYAKTVNIRQMGFVNNLHEMIYASDLVISLAGKSTIDEAKAYKTPGIFIPINGHFEQVDNAKEEGYDYKDIYRLDSLIKENINKSSRNPPAIPKGNEKAADIICSYL